MSIENSSQPELLRTQAEVRPLTEESLAEIRGKKDPYFFEFRNLTLLALPNVFTPRTDTRLLVSHLSNDLSGKQILEVATGTGTIALIAGLRGASGVAVDINPAAVKNAELNFAGQGVAIKALKSDLFTDIPHTEGPFDEIIVTPPYFDEDGEVEDDLHLAIVGGIKFVKGFFENVNDYLKSDGRILMTYAEWAGEAALRHLKKTAKAHGFVQKEIGERINRNGTLNYKLYEFRRVSGLRRVIYETQHKRPRVETIYKRSNLISC